MKMATCSFLCVICQSLVRVRGGALSDRAIPCSGDRAIRSSGDPVIERSDHREIWRAGDRGDRKIGSFFRPHALFTKSNMVASRASFDEDVVSLFKDGNLNIICNGNLSIKLSPECSPLDPEACPDVEGVHSPSSKGNGGGGGGAHRSNRKSQPTSPDPAHSFGKRKDGGACLNCMRLHRYCWQHADQDPKNQRPAQSNLNNAARKTYGVRKSDGRPCNRCIAWKRYCNLHQDQDPTKNLKA